MSSVWPGNIGRWSRNASETSSSKTSGAARVPDAIWQKMHPSVLATEDDSIGEFLGLVHQKIGWVGGKSLRLETPRHTACRDICIARGLHVHCAIADQSRFLASGAALSHQLLNAHRMRLLEIEAVAAIDTDEV